MKLAVVVITILVTQSWAAFVERPLCMGGCECYRDPRIRRGSRSVIDCSGMGLTSIPEIYYRNSGNLARVDFSDNLLTTLDIVQLYSLIRGLWVDILDFSNNNISEVVGVFDASEGRDYAALNLSNNAFTIFPSNVVPVVHYRSHLILDFTNNQLTEVSRHMFANTTDEALYGFQFLARNNSISRIDPDAFQGVTLTDTIIDLRSNQLTTLSSDFRSPRGVWAIRLSDNPWRCDCDLRWIVNPDRYLVNYTASDPPNCAEPAALRGTPVFGLQADGFACLQPRILDRTGDADVNEEAPYLNGSQVVVANGTQVTLVCPVSANPPISDIIWTLWIPITGLEPVRIQLESESVTLPSSVRAAARCTASNTVGSVAIDLLIVYDGVPVFPIRDEQE